MSAIPGSKQDKLNRSMPISKKVKFGDVLAELIAQVNKNTAAITAIAAKLDADAGVTDTNYSAQTGVGANTVKDLESR